MAMKNNIEMTDMQGTAEGRRREAAKLLGYMLPEDGKKLRDALQVIANFPITDRHRNMDAVNMAKIANNTLRDIDR